MACEFDDDASLDDEVFFENEKTGQLILLDKNGEFVNYNYFKQIKLFITTDREETVKDDTAPPSLLNFFPDTESCISQTEMNKLCNSLCNSFCPALMLTIPQLTMLFAQADSDRDGLYVLACINFEEVLNVYFYIKRINKTGIFY